MTKHARIRSILGKKIKKCKRMCRRALKKEAKTLLICWCVTAVVTFAGFGVYFLVALLGLVIEKSLVFLGGALCIGAILPLYAGNVLVARKAIRGEKTSVSLIFSPYHDLKNFWKWVYFNVILVSLPWIVALIFGGFSSNAERFLFFVDEKTQFYISVILEVLTLVVLVLALSKSIYLFFSYGKFQKYSIKNQVDASSKLYAKHKSYFLRYMLSHFWLYLLAFFSTKLPLWVGVLALTFSVGYFSLSVMAFERQFRFGKIIFSPLNTEKGVRLKVKQIIKK